MARRQTRDGRGVVALWRGLVWSPARAWGLGRWLYEVPSVRTGGRHSEDGRVRSYQIVERPDGWWVQAHSWLDAGPAGDLVDVNGPFESAHAARVYVVSVQERQVVTTAAVMGRAA